MTRKEYDLVFQAFKSYRVYMTDAEEVLSEKILDDLFYPEFDKLSTDDLVADAERKLRMNQRSTLDKNEKHTIELDELGTQTHLEGQNEIMCEIEL